VCGGLAAGDKVRVWPRVNFAALLCGQINL
jgi:hypothetical protein